MICEICGAEGAIEQITLNHVEYNGKETFLELKFTECLECDSDYCDPVQAATNAKEMIKFKEEIDG